MNILKKLFGSAPTAPSTDEEHAVIVRFTYGKDSLENLHALEKVLNTTIDHEAVGEYDGHDIAVDLSDGILYMYGPNADKLFDSVNPILESTDFTKGASVTLRYGPPEDGVTEKELKIKS